MVTSPVGVVIVTGKAAASATVDVDGGATSPALQAAAKTARAARSRNKRDMVVSSLSEEALRQRDRPSSEGSTALRSKGDLACPLEGHHSCGTAPESHRTSLQLRCPPPWADAVTESYPIPVTSRLVKRAVFVAIAIAGTAAALVVAALRDRRPEAPRGSWEPVEHRPPGD